MNEGRVVGVSSYEEYVRQLKSVDPTFDVCTEREWLSSSLGMGSSLVLKIPAHAGQPLGSNMYMYQLEAPTGCHLGAGSSIVASYFYGECEVDEKGWGTYVQSYGSLISNTEQSCPSDDATSVTTETVPLGNVVDELVLPDSPDVSESANYTVQHKRLNEYVKIVDGLVIQPGYWKRSSVDSPYKDFYPDLTKSSVIRLTFMEPIANDFYVLLTGFTNRSILVGTSKFDTGSVNTDNPQDGDFLGCESWPWACKIQFTSSPAVDYLLKTSLKSGSRNLKVETFEDRPLIKVTSNNLLDTTVYSRRSNTTLGTSTDYFGNPTTTWEGNTSAESWYGNTRDQNVVSECNDPSLSVSGQETVITHNLANQYDTDVPLGLEVTNKYESDDRDQIKNGYHGGWYHIEIDPYRLIKDLIDEVMSRFNYVDKRLDEIEYEIEQEIIHRQDGDKYVLNQVYNSSEGSLSQLINLINQLLDVVYNPDGDLGLKITWEDVELDEDYDESITGTIRKPSFSWETGKDGNPIVPDVQDGRIPRAKLNIYSGDQSGTSATDWLRSRADNSENDLYAR